MKLKILWLYLVSMIVLGSFTGCATVPREKIPPALHTNSLNEICAKNNVRWRWDSVSQLITLTYDGREATALVDSEVVIVVGEEVSLSAPLKIVRSSITVPPDFASKVIDRLRRDTVPAKAEDIPAARPLQIVLDPGHGGKDPGAIGLTGTHEKNIVLDIARRLKKLLEEKHFKVIMTRDSDEFISLQKRTEIAAQQQADIFVSVHANANPSKTVSGLEVYSLKSLDYTEKKEEQRMNNHKLLYRKMEMDRDQNDVGQIVSDMLYDYKQARSSLLSSQVARELSEYAKIKNRGTKVSRFFVLRNTLIPAVLVEVGFLTNAKEEKQLRDESYRQKIAQGISNGILDYVKAQ